MLTKYDVIVCGAGVQGLATAYYLANQKKKVLVLEQFPLPHRRGSSHGPSRIIRYSYDTKHHAEMMPECFESWKLLEKISNTSLLVETGLVTLLDDTKKDVTTGILSALEINHTYYEGEDAHKRFPGLSLDKYNGAVYEPTGAVLKADACLKAFQKCIVEKGGSILDAQKVVKINPIDLDNVEVVTQAGNRYLGNTLVLTCGPWINKVLKPSLQIRVPVQAVKIRVMYWKVKQTHSGIYDAPKFPCVIVDDDNGHVYSLPVMEYPDMMKVCFHYGAKIDPDAPAVVNKGAQAIIDRQMEKLTSKVIAHYPHLQPVPDIEESCIYTMTRDRDFIIDHHPDYSNIIIGAGFSGHGFKLAPMVGQLLGEMAIGRKPSHPIHHYSLSRFNKNLSYL